MINHILQADGIQKRYSDKLTLSDIYIKCQTGEIIGLLGRNGSGKSTLLKIIFGIVPADCKSVRINNISKNTNKQVFKDISYLHQENYIPQQFSVEKAVKLTVEKQLLTGFFADEIISKIKNIKISKLSGGELRYLEIKMILASASKFVLLDEPYNGLSPLMIEKVNAMILESRQKKGIILTDHNYNNVIQISDKLILMQSGKTHQIKHSGELIEKGYLLNGML